MTKEELIALGATEELAGKIADTLKDGYIPKTQLDEVKKENETLKASGKEYEKQLEELKKSVGDNKALAEQIAQLQAQNAEQKKAHEAEINQLKLDNAIDNALSAAGAKNNKALRALLDSSKLKLGDDGKVTGLEDQIAALQKSDAYMFHDKTTKFKSFQPGNPSLPPDKNVDFSKMSYDELSAYLDQNPGVTLPN